MIYYKKYYHYLEITALLIAAFLFNFLYIINFDEGAVLAGAWSLFNGKNIYYDFFEITPPGSFYLVLSVWKIFGANYASIRIVSILFLFIGACGLFKIIRDILKGKYPLFFTLIFILMFGYSPLISYHLYSLVFIIWSVYFFLVGLQKFKNTLFIISGFLLGISMLFLHHRGLAVLAGLSVYLIFLYLRECYKKRFSINYSANSRKHKCFHEYKKKTIFLFVASALIPPAILLFFWPFNLLFKHLIIFPLFNYTEAASVPLNTLFSYFIIFSLITFYLYKKNRRAIIFLFILQIFLFISVLPTADNIHIFYIIFPFYCLLSLLAHTLTTASPLKRYLSLATIIIMIFIFLLQHVMLFLNYPALPLHRPLTDDKVIVYAMQMCRDYEYIYAGPFIPNYYFVLKKKNPTPYSWLITNHHTNKQFAEAANYLTIKRPGCALLNYDAAIRRYNYNRDNPVDEFIKNNYTFKKRFKQFSLYIIKKEH